MTKYVVKFPPVRYKGQDHDTTIDLPDEVANPLIAIGVIGHYDPNAPIDLLPLPDDDEIEEDGDDDTMPLDKINLNSAIAEDLIPLKYVGKSIAQKLIKGQPYQSLMEAQFASGLTPDQWAEIEGRLAV